MDNKSVEERADQLYPDSAGPVSQYRQEIQHAAYIKGRQEEAAVHQNQGVIGTQGRDSFIQLIGDSFSWTESRWQKMKSLIHAHWPVSEGEGMQQGFVELNCMYCGESFIGPEPEKCCSGQECGCMGMPIDPVVCSRGCHDMLMQGKGVIFDNRSAPPVAIQPLPSPPQNQK